MASDKGNAQGLGSINKITPLGQTGPDPDKGQAINNWLGIDSRIAEGTTGSRPDMSARYGGDVNDGTFFKGNSVATDNKQLNSGGNEAMSDKTGQYGPGSPEWLKGTYGARENMPKYGGGPATPGKLVGAGAGATAIINGADQLKRDLPTQPGQDLLKGTNEDNYRNMPRAKAGIGKPGSKGQRM